MGDLFHLWLPLLLVCTAELLLRIEGFGCVSPRADLGVRLPQLPVTLVLPPAVLPTALSAAGGEQGKGFC